MKIKNLLYLIVSILVAVLFGGCSSLAALAPQTSTPAPTGTLPLAATWTPAPPFVGTSIPSTVITAVAVTVIPSQLTPGARASSTPVPNTGKLVAPDLRYALIARFGTLFFCDPDSYPVARFVTDEQVAARVAEIQKDTETFQSILKHNGLTGLTILSTVQKRLIYEEYKKLSSISLEPSGGNYAFALRASEAGSIYAYEGSVAASGVITVSKRVQSAANCPICLTGETLIDTPNGLVAVKDLGRGMPVWTRGANGERRVVAILETIKRDIPFPHALTRIELSDGRVITVSPVHPTSDGRTVGELNTGDILDGSTVLDVESVWVPAGATYDILPAGETGLYWAGGILLKSTLR